MMANIKEDYKETELGSIPTSWNVVKLEEVANYINGFPFKPTQWEKSGKPIIRIQNLTESSDKINYFNGFIDKKYEVSDGDILISWSASLGVFKWGKGNAWLNQHIFKVTNYSPKIFKGYFYFVVGTRLGFMKEKTHGSTMHHITKLAFLDVKIPIPPLPEQQKIAYVLSTVQQAQEKTERVINSLKELKKSMMKHLFSYGIVGLENNEKVKLKETEVGKVPYAWLESRIKDHSKITTGGTPKTSVNEYYFPQEVPWMKSGEIQGHKITKIDTYISKLGLENSNARLLPKGSVVIALAGRGKTRGTTAVLEVECACNQSVVCIIPTGGLLPYYLHYYLSNLYSYIRNLTGDEDRTGLNMELVGKIPLILPTLPEQKQIAEILSSIDTKVEAEENRKEALEQLFKSLLSNLMSAKIRVNNLKIVS